MAKQKYTPRKREPKKTFRGQRPIKQRIWDYMRRNKLFKPSEIEMILDVKPNTLRSFLYGLEVAGFVRKKGDGKRAFKDTTFVFIAKDNILDAPAVSTTEVYCFYSKISCDIGARKLLFAALKELSQEAVGDKIGISKASVNLLIHNKYPNPAPMYKKIRETL